MPKWKNRGSVQHNRSECIDIISEHLCINQQPAITDRSSGTRFPFLQLFGAYLV